MLSVSMLRYKALQVLFSSSWKMSPRSFRVDVHHHIFPPELISSKLEVNARIGWRTPPENLPWSPELSLNFMDSLAIDAAILSYPANVPSGPPGPETCARARELNSAAARICHDHPGRFRFFACLPDPRDTGGSCSPETMRSNVLERDFVFKAR